MISAIFLWNKNSKSCRTVRTCQKWLFWKGV